MNLRVSIKAEIFLPAVGPSRVKKVSADNDDEYLSIDKT
jgi:hypothetical protein